MNITTETRKPDEALEKQQVITCDFPGGMIGFPENNTYNVTLDPKYYPFIKMKSTGGQEVNFVLVDPWSIKEDYEIELPNQVLKTLGTKDPSKMLILCVVTFHKKRGGISINLAAPVVINTNKREGLQIIQDNEDLPIQYFVKT